MTFANAAPRCIGEIGIAYRIFIVDLVEDAVVRSQIFDGSAGQIIGVDIPVECIQLKCLGGWSVEQSTNEPNAAPAGLGKKALIHQRSGDSSDEYALRLPVDDGDGEVHVFGVFWDSKENRVVM